MDSEEGVRKAREYYNSPGAQGFYSTFWGGEDIHIGIYEPPDLSIREASRRTVDRMASGYPFGPETRVLDLGAGYGGSARHLSRSFGCETVCLNLSAVQNERNRRLNREQGLESLVSVVEGNFESLPFGDGSFDVVWSQDAMLHSGRRTAILSEVARVLRTGGAFIFTDPMQSEEAEAATLAPVLDRLDLDSLATPTFYREELGRLGFSEARFTELSAQLVNHYTAVLEAIERDEARALEVSGSEYVERMRRGLAHWISAGSAGALVWGVFQFQK